MEMVVGDGYISFVVSELQLIICLSTVLIAMLVNSTAKIVRMANEKNPPVAVEYYPSPLYFMNCETEKRSHIARSAFSPRVNFASMSD